MLEVMRGATGLGPAEPATPLDACDQQKDHDEGDG